jgi:hypothetical protein
MTSRRRRPGFQWGCAALILLIVNAPNAGWGQASAPAASPVQLPPAAQEALNKGIIAAKVPDYLLAIRYFEEARTLAPQAPIVFMNLGIAESKIPGRELRAIAWLAAYLAASPDAPNAAAVKEQIAVLEVRNQSNVSRLIKSIEHPANQTTSPNKLLFTVDQLNLINLRSVAQLWAKAGDITAALRSAKLITGNAYADIYRSNAHRAIAEAQAAAGDIVGAKKTAALLQESGDQATAQRAIVEAQQNRSGAAITARDWLERLDDEDNHIDHHDCALNSAPFLDLAGYVKSLPSSDNSQNVFDRSFGIAWTLATAQHVIHQMLKRQDRK